MSRLILMASEDDCRRLSAELWAFSRPLDTRHPDDVTEFAFGWRKHSDRDEWALDLPDGFVLRRSKVLTGARKPVDVEIVKMAKSSDAATAMLGRDRITTDDLTAAAKSFLTESQARSAGWFDTTEERG